MKKNQHFPDHERSGIKKLLIVMKLTTIFLFLSAMAMAASTFSQNVRFDLTVKDASIIQVFDEIERVSDYGFLFKTDQLDLNRKYTLDLKKANIEKVLKEILDQNEFTYNLIDRNIVISRIDSPSNQDNKVNKVSGKVSDSSGLPLPGASVVLKGTTSGTITDANGQYSISNVPENAILKFSFIGMLSQEVEVGNQSTIDISMEVDAIGIEEVVAVGYGTMKKSDLSGSVATVKGEILAQTKTASLTGAIAGRLPGIVTKQSSGEPGMDRTSISIRGFGSPLVIVDGIERDFNDLNPEEVESMTILKDASAAIYGARAGNGVILVTTKRGNNTKPQIIINSTYTLQGLTKFPSAVNSGQYAELMNEFNTNDGFNPIYSDEAIEKYYNGSDPLNYPNTDWWDITMNDYSPQLQTDASLRGGNEKVKYFTLLSFLDQQGMYKSGDNKYKRYNVRSNLDAMVTKDLSVSVDLSMIVQDIKSPLRSVSNIWQDFYGSLPTYLGELPDRTKIAYGGSAPVSPIAGTTFDQGGYEADKNTHINIKTSLKYNVPGVKGLSLEALGSYFQYRNEYKNWQKSYNVYEYDAKSDSYFDRGSTFSTRLDQGYAARSSFTTQLSASYERTFADKHSVDALVLYERIDEKAHNVAAHGENFLTDAIDYLFAAGGEGQTVSGGASEDGRESYIGRLNYNYASKYFLQSTLRYDGSPRFFEDKQWGWFPSFSAAWRISEEGFLKDNVSWLENLKLRASFSNMGYDATGNFQYLSGYEITTGSVGPNVNSGYVVDGVPLTTIHSTGLANPNITWENMTIYNIGLDFSIFNALLYGEMDVFYRERTDMLATRILSLPNTFGANLPEENINSQNNRGFELLLGHKNSIGEFNYDIGGNVSWTRAKWDHYEEPIYEDLDDIRINQRSRNWADRVFAYKSDGLFTSQEEIDAYTLDQDTKGNATIRPGDIKYVDISGPEGVPDGKLDWRDQVEIGRSITPELNFGLNLAASYKGFDFAMLWQGAGNYDVMISPNIMPASDRTPYTFVYENRWTMESNDANSLLPRISATGNVNNSKSSDYWYVDGTYIRLKNLSFGYTLPAKLTSVVGIQKARFYFSGTNLLTFSGLNKWDYDPEGPSNSRSWYYPQQKTLSLGLSLTL